MEVDEQSDRDMQQLHVTEELRFATSTLLVPEAGSCPP